MEKKNYKHAENLVGIKTVPKSWVGYDNPFVEVIVRKGVYSEKDEHIIISVIADAIIKIASLTGVPLKREQHIKTDDV